MEQPKLNTNIEAYKTQEALEKYSHYGLYPNERYLFEKYFNVNEPILDLACGAGRTTLRLHELGYKVKGIDLSEPLIEMARRRFPSLEFEVGSYCDIREADNSYSQILISHNGLDYAYPESERVKAIRECHRVLTPGGKIILSGHNIKSLHGSPYYLASRKMWLARNMVFAFKSHAYIYDLGMYTFFASPRYFEQQFNNAGFTLLEMIGFRSSGNSLFNYFISPYIHYVFVKKEP